MAEPKTSTTGDGSSISHPIDSPTYHNDTHENAVNRLRAAESVTMSPELFEKLYLTPKTPVAGPLRQMFGNPTPIALTGFVVGLTPLSCCLMGWRGSGGLGAANIGVFFFIGGPLLMISGILEFFLANTFPAIVFMIYGGIFFAFAATLNPLYASATSYSTTGNFSEGFLTAEFNSSLAFFPIMIAALHVLFFIAATRINVVFLVIFASAFLGFTLLSSALWAGAEGASAISAQLEVGTGACLFVTSLAGWYLLTIQILASTGVDCKFPVGDLSHFWNKKAIASHEHDA